MISAGSLVTLLNYFDEKIKIRVAAAAFQSPETSFESQIVEKLFIPKSLAVGTSYLQ